jgi:hypothetical protein
MSITIIAQLTGSDRCTSAGLTVRGYAPVLGMCRTLVAAGFNPDSPLHAYRGAMLCLRIRSIGEGAKLTIEDNGCGTPVAQPWRDPPAIGTASPVRPPRQAATHALAGGRQ